MRQNGVAIKIRNSLSRLLTAKSRSVRGASHQPAFMAWERWEGSEVARCEWWESGEVGRWEVPGFIQGWGTHGESKI